MTIFDGGNRFIRLADMPWCQSIRPNFAPNHQLIKNPVQYFDNI